MWHLNLLNLFTCYFTQKYRNMKLLLQNECYCLDANKLFLLRCSFSSFSHQPSATHWNNCEIVNMNIGKILIHCITFLTFAHSDQLIHGTSMKTLLITKDRQKVVTAKYPSYSLSHRNCIVGRHLTGHNALIDTSYDRVYNNFHKNQQKIMQRCDHCMKISHNVQSVAKNEQHCTQIWQQLKTVPQQDSFSQIVKMNFGQLWVLDL